jgi:Leucine-rich repeat (LRR) protein
MYMPVCSIIQLSGLAIQTVSVDALVGIDLKRLQEVHLDNNAISNIFPGTFHNLTYLTVLDLSNNRLTTLDPNAFRGLTSLSTLYLYNNYLESLPSDMLFDDMGDQLSELRLDGNQLTHLLNKTFAKLAKLQTLQLNDNRLNAVDKEAFSMLGSLSELKLQSNELGSDASPFNWTLFSGLSRLKTLDLSNNNFARIDGTAFATLPNLISLKIFNNQLQELQAGSFGNLTKLQILDVSYNRLETLPGDVFGSLVSLLTLYLDGNRLATVTKEMFSGLQALQVLTIARNSISTIPSDLFQNMPELIWLDVTRNRIETLVQGTFCSCQKLSSVYFRNNRLNSLSSGVFSNLSSLLFLYLGSNLIPSLDSGVFQNLSSLNYLELSSNRISKIDSNAFANVPNLTSLLLDGNAITAVPVTAMSQLRKLSTVNLNDNSLNSIPDAAFMGLTNLNRLYLSDNYILNFGQTAFAGCSLKKLAFLDLSESQISTIPVGLFEGGLDSLANLNLSTNLLTSASLANRPFASLSDQLTILDLSANQITYIPDDLFDELRALHTLNLDSNKISSLNFLSLDGLVALSSLSLTNNALNSAALSSITNLPVLSDLHLDTNAINSLPDDSFSQCPSLSSLGLRNNYLTTLNARALQNLENIIKLDLGYNRLSAEALANLSTLLPQLYSISLDGNVIGASLSPTTFLGGERTVGFLDLSNNGLTSDGLFPAIVILTHLTILIVDDNQLTHLPPIEQVEQTLAASLETLSLRNNQITLSSTDVLAEFTKLSSLYLDGNKIAGTLPRNLFTRMFVLSQLTLDNNQIDRLDNDTFEVIDRTLTRLSMANNLVSFIDEATFVAMQNINDLDLRGNLIASLRLPVLMPQLNRLMLADNLLTQFPLGLRSFPLLTSLDVSHNLLTQLPSIALYSQNTISLINWSNNQLHSIDNMTYVGAIDCLNFSLNSVSDIKTDILYRVTHIGELDLSNNKLHSIPLALTTAADVIIVLYLNYNRISQLDNWAKEGSISTNIQRLFMRNNNISYIPDSMMAALSQSLVQLDVRNNLLISIDEQLFINSTQVLELNLDDNPWNCDCHLSYLRRLEMERSIDIGWPVCRTPSTVAGLLVVCYDITTCFHNSSYPQDETLLLINDTKCLEFAQSYTARSTAASETTLINERGSTERPSFSFHLRDNDTSLVTNPALDMTLPSSYDTTAHQTADILTEMAPDKTDSVANSDTSTNQSTVSTDPLARQSLESTIAVYKSTIPESSESTTVQMNTTTFDVFVPSPTTVDKVPKTNTPETATIVLPPPPTVSPMESTSVLTGTHNESQSFTSSSSVYVTSGAETNNENANESVQTPTLLLNADKTMPAGEYSDVITPSLSPTSESGDILTETASGNANSVASLDISSDQSTVSIPPLASQPLKLTTAVYESASLESVKNELHTETTTEVVTSASSLMNGDVLETITSSAASLSSALPQISTMESSPKPSSEKLGLISVLPTISGSLLSLSTVLFEASEPSIKESNVKTTASAPTTTSTSDSITISYGGRTYRCQAEDTFSYYNSAQNSPTTSASHEAYTAQQTTTLMSGSSMGADALTAAVTTESSEGPSSTLSTPHSISSLHTTESEGPSDTTANEVSTTVRQPHVDNKTYLTHSISSENRQQELTYNVSEITTQPLNGGEFGSRTANSKPTTNDKSIYVTSGRSVTLETRKFATDSLNGDRQFTPSSVTVQSNQITGKITLTNNVSVTMEQTSTSRHRAYTTYAAFIVSVAKNMTSFLSSQSKQTTQSFSANETRNSVRQQTTTTSAEMSQWSTSQQQTSTVKSRAGVDRTSRAVSLTAKANVTSQLTDTVAATTGSFADDLREITTIKSRLTSTANNNVVTYPTSSLSATRSGTSQGLALTTSATTPVIRYASDGASTGASSARPLPNTTSVTTLGTGTSASVKTTSAKPVNPNSTSNSNRYNSESMTSNMEQPTSFTSADSGSVRSSPTVRSNTTTTAGKKLRRAANYGNNYVGWPVFEHHENRATDVICFVLITSAIVTVAVVAYANARAVRRKIWDTEV